MDLEYLRDNGRIDINVGIQGGQINIDEYENKGARNKFWFNNHQFLYKEIFSDSYEDFAEIIASEIALELGMDCAYYDIAKFNGKNGVVTRNFVNDTEEELISGTEIINEVYQRHIVPLQEIWKKYLEILKQYGIKEDFSNIQERDISQKKDALSEICSLCEVSKINLGDLANLNKERISLLSEDELNKILIKCNQMFNDFYGMYDLGILGNGAVLKTNNLFDLISMVDIYGKLNDYKVGINDELMKGLADLFVYDIITCQGDRHSDNWGIILNRNTSQIRLAPIFDNSNMCNLNRTKAIEAINYKVEALNSGKYNGNKAKRTEELLKREIYHARSLLGVDPSNIENREKNIAMMEQFVLVSSSEIIDELRKKLQLLSSERIDMIFSRIEDRIKIAIPQNIKNVVSKTIEINLNEFEQILNKKEGRLYGK